MCKDSLCVPIAFCGSVCIYCYTISYYYTNYINNLNITE